MDFLKFSLDLVEIKSVGLNKTLESLKYLEYLEHLEISNVELNDTSFEIFKEFIKDSINLNSLKLTGCLNQKETNFFILNFLFVFFFFSQMDEFFELL